MPKILVVDDERHTTNLLATALDMMGYQALAANSGAQALEMIAEEEPDVVLLDYMMPELDGLETLKRIRSQPNGDQLPVIMITAFPEEEVRQRAHRQGISGFFEKPLTFDRLEQLLAEIAPPALPA